MNYTDICESIDVLNRRISQVKAAKAKTMDPVGKQYFSGWLVELHKQLKELTKLRHDMVDR